MKTMFCVKPSIAFKTKKSQVQQLAVIYLGFTIYFLFSYLSLSAIAKAMNQSRETSSKSASSNAWPVKFKLVKTSNGQSDDGTWWSIFDLVTSDGHKLYKQNFPFSSVDRAKKQVQLYVTHAAKIIRRSPELDQKGDIAGERILALFGRNDNKEPKPQYILFWRFGRDFYQIAGEHLDDVLTLDSRLKEKPLTELVKE